MRKVVHVSDLHFGKADMAVMDSLVAVWRALQPDLVIISGDLTQRAKAEEFAEVQTFLKRLEREKLSYLVIPGNHDIVPIYRPLGRLLGAYKNYRTYISAQTEFFYHDGELAVASINTVKRSHAVNGRVANAQITQTQEWFAQFPEAVKIVVTHHPLHRNNSRSSKLPCWRGKKALKALESSEVDVYLCGHHHHSSISHERSISVHAGTVSERTRGEPPSFNLLTIDSPRMTIETYHWQAPKHKFESRMRKEFVSSKNPPPKPKAVRVVREKKRLVSAHQGSNLGPSR